MEFCNNNDLQLIVRAHECVMDGFERFAQGHLITLFSATNYCGMDMLFLDSLFLSSLAVGLAPFAHTLYAQVRQTTQVQS